MREFSSSLLLNRNGIQISTPQHWKDNIISTLQYFLSTLDLLNQQDGDQTTTINNSSLLNQTDCNPALFTLGKWSREKDPKVEYGLCPDSIVTPIFAGLFLALFLSVVIISVMGIIWKRKNGYVQSRNPILMIMTIVAACILVIPNCLRFIISRKVFPCALYTAVFFVIPPMVSLPTILRCLRLFLMYKMNLQKTKLFELTNKSTVSNIVDPSSNKPTSTQVQTLELDEESTQKKGDLETTNIDNSAINQDKLNETKIYGNEDLIQRRSTINDLLKTMDPEKSMELNSKSIVLQPIQTKTFLESSQTENGQSFQSFSTDANSQQDLIDSSPRMVISPLHDVKSSDMFEDFASETDDSMDSASDFDARSTWAFKDLSDLRSEVKLFKVFTFMSSYKFAFILYLCFVSFQITLWLILGGVEEAIFSNNSNSGERIFLLEGGMLVFTRGCSMSTTMVLIIGGEAIIYIILEIISLVLCIKSDRDTWSIKKEAIIVIIFQIIVVIAFVVTGMIDIIVTLTDYFIPYGYSLLLFSLIEVITTVLLPVVYGIVKDYRDFINFQNQRESDVEQVLKNKKTFDKLLDFARRSYAPESVLCYRDIQRFKKARSTNRKKMANHIVNTYLTNGSPLELNIDSIIQRKNDYSEKINSLSEQKLPRTLFNVLQEHCLIDMRDVFERLKSADREISQMMNDWREKQFKLQGN